MLTGRIKMKKKKKANLDAGDMNAKTRENLCSECAGALQHGGRKADAVAFCPSRLFNL